MFVRNNNIVFILYLTIIPIIFSCSKTENNETYNSVTIVKTASANFLTLDNNLNSFGTVMYRNKNDITAQIEGTIISLPVKEGDMVNRGQQIAVLRNIQMEIQRDQYENALVSANAAFFVAETKLAEAKLSVEGRLLSLERSNLNLRQLILEYENAIENLSNKEQLHSIGGITDAELKNIRLSVSSMEAEISILRKEIEIAQLGLREMDLIQAGFIVSDIPEEKKWQLIELNTRSYIAELETARASVRNAEKSLDSIQKQLDELNIRSTVTGIVGALYFENGEYVPRNEKIATVMNISTVYAVFYIQEQDIINFSLGAPLEIEIPSLGLAHNAHIDEISPIADPQSGNFSIKAEINNENLVIRPGMFIKCIIRRIQNVEYLAVPETTLVKFDGSGGSVFCVVNGIAVLKSVTIQAQKNGIIWITAGLIENETVIDKPSPFLKEGEYVQAE